MTRFTAMRMPLGSLGMAATPRGLAFVVVTGQTVSQTRKMLQSRFESAEYEPDVLFDLQEQLGEYFAGRKVRFHTKVDLSELTDFQRQVLNACRRIGYGKTKTYGDLAREVGRPRATRAVGQALGRNPVPLVIPCHRVIGCNGQLTGFSAEQGVKLKRWLLDLEQSGKARR
jgi:methylated-DNA-[protein]-cysteine S-methyltransferase